MSIMQPMENAKIRGPEFRNDNSNGAGVNTALNQLNTEVMANNMPLPGHQDGSISSNTKDQFNPYESVTSAYNTNDIIVKDSAPGGKTTASIITMPPITNNEVVMTKN